MDPGIDPSDVVRFLKKEEEYIPKFVLGTHGHHDHIQSAFDIMDFYEIPLLIHPRDFRRMTSENVKYIKEPDVITIGAEELHVIDTPGHTSGGVALIDYTNRIIFAGDTIIRGTIPRQLTDFDELIQSIRKILTYTNVDDDFIIYPGHGGKTTVENEKKSNPYRKYLEK